MHLNWLPIWSIWGVSHVYSSPILTARAGSIHGYDVVDPTSVNPELGGERGFRDFVAVLRAAGLGLIVDIVPNHMAVGRVGQSLVDGFAAVTADPADTLISSTWTGKRTIPTCAAKCWLRFLGGLMARRWTPGKSDCATRNPGNR